MVTYTFIQTCILDNSRLAHRKLEINFRDFPFILLPTNVKISPNTFTSNFFTIGWFVSRLASAELVIGLQGGFGKLLGRSIECLNLYDEKIIYYII